jgi:hypothetical protein
MSQSSPTEALLAQAKELGIQPTGNNAVSRVLESLRTGEAVSRNSIGAFIRQFQDSVKNLPVDEQYEKLDSFYRNLLIVFTSAHDYVSTEFLAQLRSEQEA